MKRPTAFERILSFKKEKQKRKRTHVAKNHKILATI